jgi:UDP-N-acetylglucosamine 2-epimerase (non-hydrolysing)
VKKILCVVGTRPEAIKMIPVILSLKRESWVNCRVLATAQHRGMLDQVLKAFGITPDIDLDIMRPNQTLSELTARLLTAADGVLIDELPDAVLAQGDTTTTMVLGLSCFYRQIAFGHVEAGLRTGNIWNPFPEELNRVIAGRLAKWHFAPTARAAANLIREGISDECLYLTGNTVIDTLFMSAERNVELGVSLDPRKRMILVTAHRRENFGEPFLRICRAIRVLADKNQDVQFLYPVHPNPNIQQVAYRELANHSRIVLCEPLEYLQFVSAMKRAFLILTDSGGVQEEAPALAKPVLVLRDETERPEAVEEGVVRLVGTDTESIVAGCQLLLDNPAAYKTMARGVSPYGDGHASTRIVKILKDSMLNVNN